MKERLGEHEVDRRVHDRTGTRSTISASSGHSVGWQYTFAVRGHRSFTFNTIPVGHGWRLT